MGRRNDRPPQRSTAPAPLPEAFIAQLREQLGNEFPAFEEVLALAPPTSIRLNPRKPFTIAEEAVPWCLNGRYVNERPAFTLDPLLHAGAYYVQEASSMLLEQAVIAAELAGRDVLALDLCAAPGGKSTHLLSLLGEGSLLVANEPVPDRRNILAENLWKHGAGNVIIAGSDTVGLERLPEFFDLILVDAPCSGEGMFRKDAFAREQWSPKLVERCTATQRNIVAHAWDALAPGGTLIYSTCTWENGENESQLEPLLASGGQCLELPLRSHWGVVRTELNGVIGHRCYPHRLRGEGFFIATVRKPGTLRSRERGIPVRIPHELPWLRPDAALTLREHRDVLHASPSAWNAEVDTISAALHIHAPGIPLAERKGDAWTPHPAAALSSLLHTGTLALVDVDAQQAMAYLAGEALPATEARGMALITYHGHALGWVQGAGKRWNNRWPAPWRIRTQRSALPRVSWARP